MSLPVSIQQLVTDALDFWPSLSGDQRQERLDTIALQVPPFVSQRLRAIMEIHQAAPFKIHNRLINLLDANYTTWNDELSKEPLVAHVEIWLQTILLNSPDSASWMNAAGELTIIQHFPIQKRYELLGDALKSKIQHIDSDAELVKTRSQIEWLTQLNPAFPAYKIDALRHCHSIQSERAQVEGFEARISESLRTVEKSLIELVLAETKKSLPARFSTSISKIAKALAEQGHGKPLILLRECFSSEAIPIEVIQAVETKIFLRLIDVQRFDDAHAYWSQLKTFIVSPHILQEVKTALRRSALGSVSGGRGSNALAVSNMHLDYFGESIDLNVFDAAKTAFQLKAKNSWNDAVQYFENISPAIASLYLAEWTQLRVVAEETYIIRVALGHIQGSITPHDWSLNFPQLPRHVSPERIPLAVSFKSWVESVDSGPSLESWALACPKNSEVAAAFTSQHGGDELRAAWLQLQTEMEEKAHTHVLQTLLDTRKWQRFDRHLTITGCTGDTRTLWMSRKTAAIAQFIEPFIPLDQAQARILASPAKTIRVTARAGSGKTRLLTALSYFLVNDCGHQPDQILLLAFNKKAAEQLEERLIQLLGVPAFPGARTFHSLAYGIAQPEEALIFDQGDDINSQQLTRCVQDILKSQLSDSMRDEIYGIFRRETAIAKSTGAFLVGSFAYDYRRALNQFTLGGYAVKSLGEKFIGDFLFEHGLTHYYEDPIRWQGVWYRPDFKIMTGEKTYLIWEHWAVDPDAEQVVESRDWSVKDLRNYQRLARAKREYWETKGVPLIETIADKCGNREQFERQLTTLLLPHIPNLQPLPKEALLDRVITIHLSKLAGWLAQAIQRSQKLGWDASALAQLLEEHSADSERERLFLDLLRTVFAAYEPKLVAENLTDFDRLFNRAISLMRATPPQTIIAGKQTTIDLRQLRVCLVDEAQDLSPQFVEALCCLREINPALRLIFVGDDWQAINRFAGSSVELFTEAITTRFGKCATANLATNYRSVLNVVLSGNQLMEGQGIPATPNKTTPGIIEMALLDKVWIEFREGSARAKADEPFREFRGGAGTLLKAIYQLAIPDLLAGHTVGVLFRTNYSHGQKINDLEKAFVRILRKMEWPREQVLDWQKAKIRFSTAHKFKGAECHTVFVVGPYAGCFPLINADSIELFRFFGDTLKQAEEDERRLFYVALTRAAERLVFLTETQREEDSPYLVPIRHLIKVIKVPDDPLRPEGSSAKAPVHQADLEADSAPPFEEQTEEWSEPDGSTSR